MFASTVEALSLIASAGERGASPPAWTRPRAKQEGRDI